MSAVLTDIRAFDHERHLGAERLRILDLLDDLLRVQRSRGRTPAADALAGAVIEDGEAEGLIRELRTASHPREVSPNGATADHAERRARTARAADKATAAGAPLPLWRARQMFELRPDEYDALLLALLVECDARFARLCAYLNDHVGRPRPTVGLARAVADLQGLACDPLACPERPILADGLLTLEGDGPLPSRALRLDAVQARRLTSLVATPEPGIHVAPPDPAVLGRLVLDGPLRAQLERWAEDIGAGRRDLPVVVVTGPEGSGRSTVARAAAGLAGRALVAGSFPPGDPVAAMRLLRREARWYGAAMVVGVPAGTPAGEDLWRAVSRPPDLLFLDAGEREAADLLATAPAEPALWRCATPDTSGRSELWQCALPRGAHLDAAAAEALASSFRFGPAAIARAVRRAEAERNGAPVDHVALARAAREQVGQGLRNLADRLPLPYERSDLVLPPETDRELDLALAWSRHKAQVLDRWGLGRRVASGRGLSALFAGPPGTGKTMAAQVLSRELELDCYRIDLSKVVSKYIGETEANLSRVFDEAEIGGAVLFFDEADALFGKRSEVRDARDRYANLEIGYLLQRMEQYDGVAVLATNRVADMDEAFLRRFQVVGRFRLPVAGERRRIWSGLLPDECERAPGVNLEGLADAIELSGGEIKNCVLAAAFMAADEGVAIGMPQLTAAVRRELGKSGKLVDDAALDRLLTDRVTE